MRAAIWAVWLLAGCKTSHVLDVASHADAATAAQIETHETKSEGPEHIVMTVEEFSQLCDTPSREPAVPPNFAGGAGDIVAPSPGATGGLSSGNILLRRTVTVTDRGPSLDDLRTISSLQNKLNTATEIHTKDESKPGGIFSLWFLVGLLPLVAGVLVWKLQPAWLGAALAALKTLFVKKT